MTDEDDELRAELELLRRLKQARPLTPSTLQPPTGTTRLRDGLIARLLRRLGVWWS